MQQDYQERPGLASGPNVLRFIAVMNTTGVLSSKIRTTLSALARRRAVTS